LNDLNVYIIGFMGSGKSTVGRLLAERMGMEFIDTDELIEKKTEISIEELFKRFGEDFFREIEARILFEVSKTLGVVVACGGGVVLGDENMRLLRSTGIIVYLHVSIEELVKRLANDDKRPLLQVDNKVQVIRSLYSTRLPLYMKYADIIVDNTRKRPKDVVREIFDEIRRLEHDSLHISWKRER